MNKIKFTIKWLVVILGFVSVPFSILADDLTSESYSSSLLSDDQLENRVINMASEIDMRYTRKIGDYIRTYVNNYGRSTDQLLGRVTNYFPIFESELRKRELPQELKVLAVIESSLRPTVKSRVGAVGLWQFMSATARQYGLTINREMDERRDPFRSTEAAASYLKDLYKQFGDWTLAIAAYNCGPGRVSRAIRYSGTRDYWELQNYLPRETQNYVPKFIAAYYLMNYYYLHDITPAKPRIDLKTASLTKIYDQISFDAISNMSGISVKSIEQMNPAFIRSYIPKNETGLNLMLPEHSMYLFLESSGRINQSLESNIEQRPNPNALFVSFNDLAEPSIALSRTRMNEVKFLDKVKVEEKCVEPVKERKLYQVENLKINRDKDLFETHRLGKGESLIELISRREDLDLKEVLILNEISLSRPPSPGTIIKLKKI